MNVFYLHKNPTMCAQMHCDKHVVKMVIEYAQLLSTAHRVLDGKEYVDKTANNRRIKRWRLDDDREQLLYKASHVNHPDNIWIRQTHCNYQWVNQLFLRLCEEYEYRYGRVHETARKLYGKLTTPPKNIPTGFMTEPPQAMPYTCKMLDPIDAYRRYYIREKASFAKWTNRNTPEWFNANI